MITELTEANLTNMRAFYINDSIFLTLTTHSPITCDQCKLNIERHKPAYRVKLKGNVNKTIHPSCLGSFLSGR